MLGFARRELDLALERIEQSDSDFSVSSYGLLVKQCTTSKSIAHAKRLHDQITRHGHGHETFLGNLLVDMYAKLGDLEQASAAFHKIEAKNVFSWNIFIVAHAANGHLLAARSLFDRMPVRDTVSWSSMVGVLAESERCEEAILMNVLDACAESAALRDGKFVESVVVEDGLEADVKVGTALLNMYAKCGSLREAEELFERMPERNVVSWNALLSSYAQNGHMDEARRVFVGMPERNVVSWTGMMAGYARNGYCREALELLPRMDQEGVKPNENTFVTLLDACASVSALCEGRILCS